MFSTSLRQPNCTTAYRLRTGTFLKQYVKYISFMSNIDNDCDDCNDCGLCKEKLFLFKYFRFCFEEIFMCVLNNSQNFLRERKILSINNFLPPTMFVFSLRSWFSLKVFRTFSLKLLRLFKVYILWIWGDTITLYLIIPSIKGLSPTLCSF